MLRGISKTFLSLLILVLFLGIPGITVTGYAESGLEPIPLEWAFRRVEMMLLGVLLVITTLSGKPLILRLGASEADCGINGQLRG